MPRLIFTRCIYNIPSPPQTDPDNGLPIYQVDGELVQFAEPPDVVYEPDWPAGVNPKEANNQGG